MKVLAGTGVRVAKKNPERTESGTRLGGPAPAPSAVRVSAGESDSLGKMDGYEGSAPSIPVWKTGVCLSTPIPEGMESRTGIAPVFAVLQTAA